MIEKALSTSYAFSRIENGLYYQIITDINEMSKILINTSNRDILAFCYNFHKHLHGFYPLTLSIKNPEALYKFYSGELIITVFMDISYLAKKLSFDGFIAHFKNEKGLWWIELEDTRKEFTKIEIGWHFFLRLPMEFLSMSWFIKEVQSRNWRKMKKTIFKEGKIVNLNKYNGDLPFFKH